MFSKDQKDQLSSEPSVTNFDTHIDFRVFVGINGLLSSILFLMISDNLL